jgi:hypothetical protein
MTRAVKRAVDGQPGSDVHGEPRDVAARRGGRPYAVAPAGRRTACRTGRSLRLDVQIPWQTASAVFGARGAH